VPHVLGVEAAEEVARPRAQQVGPLDDDAHHEPAAPVVADEVDGLADLLELADQPGRVLLARGAEAGRRGDAEPGELRGVDVVAAELGEQRAPDGRGLGVAVDEDGGHGADRTRVGPGARPTTVSRSGGAWGWRR
jgi:hypothetical protein